MTDRSTPEAVRALPSAAPGQPFDALAATRRALCLTLSELERSIASDATTNGKPTRAIYGPNFSASSATVRTCRSLANRLRAETDVLGSTLYVLRWKCWDAPLEWQIPALRVSVRRISGSGCTGWPTPTLMDSRRGEKYDPFAANQTMNMAAQLTGWSTPTSRDWKDSPGMASTGVNPDGSTRDRTDMLPRQAILAGWGTPMANDKIRSEAFATGRNPNLKEGVQLAGWPTARATDGDKNARTLTGSLSEMSRKGSPQDLAAAAAIAGPARLTVSGEMLTGCSAGMESGGQLSPRLSLWLMLGPYAEPWLLAAERIDKKKVRSSAIRRSRKPAST